MIGDMKKMAGNRRRRSISRLKAAASAALTYEPVGATVAGPLPPGYHHVRRSRLIGFGAECFSHAAERLMAWGMQRGAGLRVEASSPVAAEGVVLRVGVGVGRLMIGAPCRVVRVVEEPLRRGFAYGTLPGHPLRGEELFTVTHADDDRVVAEVVAYSRPATWTARLGAPITPVMQHLMAGRYLAALDCS